MSSKNIKVVIKARPILKKEKDNRLVSQWKILNNSIRQNDSHAEPFFFDHVFDQDASNLDVFETVVKPIVDAAVKGFNGTIFAYGQTSSGKTYTMLGDEKNPGVMVLTAKEIFKEIEMAVDRQFLLRVGYIEIYNEKVFDLLNKANTDLKIHETPNGDITVNCDEFIVTSEDSLMKHLQTGSRHRRMGETNMNERSSRSHSIFRIIIESSCVDKPPDEGSVQISILNLVDLAGSERADQTGATGTRLKEGAHINKSLLYLSRVINTLSDNESIKFINYRDSKLTRILQASLGGNALTAIVCNINPTAVDETNSTLNFAMRAKCIKNKPEVNEVLSDTASIKRLQKEIARLESELQSSNSKMKVIEIERKIYEERLKIVHCHSRDKVSNLRRRTWTACVHPESVKQLNEGNILPSLSEEMCDLKSSSSLPLKIMTPLITCRDNMPPLLDQFKGNDVDFDDDTCTINDPKDIFKTPEVFKQRNRESDDSFTHDLRCRQVERELEELRDFTNLEKKFNVEHELIASLNRKLEEAQSKIIQYEEDKFGILSSKLDEWNEKEDALNQRCLNLDKQLMESNEILESMKSKEANYKMQLDQSNEKIKNLEMQLAEIRGREYELEIHQQRAKDRESELLEALEEREKEMKNLSDKLKFANDLHNQKDVFHKKQDDLESTCEKCKEYQSSFNEVLTENLKLRNEKSTVQKENDELSSQLMEALQECDSLKTENEKLQGEILALKEHNINFRRTEESKLEFKKNTILKSYQEFLICFPELTDKFANVNSCFSCYDLLNWLEEFIKECINKINQLNDNIINHKLNVDEIQKKNNDLLEELKKHEDEKLNVKSLNDAREQENNKLTNDLQILKFEDNYLLDQRDKGVDHKLDLEDVTIPELRSEVSNLNDVKEEGLQKLINLESLKAKNNMLCEELSESTNIISKHVDEIKNLTKQIEILEQQVNKEKASSPIKMEIFGDSTILVNENTFVDNVNMYEIPKVENFDGFIINLNMLNLVLTNYTANINREEISGEQYGKLVVRDVLKNHDTVIYLCAFNEEIIHNENDKHVLLFTANRKDGVKVEIKCILKSEILDKDDTKETLCSSYVKNVESTNVNHNLLLKKAYEHNAVVENSKIIEGMLRKFESEAIKICTLFDGKTKWLEQKLSHLEASHDVNLKKQKNLFKQIENFKTRMERKALELSGLIEAFETKFQNIEKKLEATLKNCFFKVKHQSEHLTEKNNSLSSEIVLLKKVNSDINDMVQDLKAKNNELKDNLIRKEEIISDLRKENDKLAEHVSHLESTVSLQKNSVEENLERVFTTEDSNKDSLNKFQNSGVEVTNDQVYYLESQNKLRDALDEKEQSMNSKEKSIEGKNYPGLNVLKDLKKDLNEYEQSCISINNTASCNSELNSNTKLINNLLTNIDLCIKGQCELSNQSKLKIDDDVIEDVPEYNFSLIGVKEKLEELSQEIHTFHLDQNKDIEHLKETITLLQSQNRSEILKMEKYIEELEQKLIDFKNIRALLEKEVQLNKTTLAQKIRQNDEINCEMKFTHEENEKLNKELLHLNEIKALLENRVKDYEEILAQTNREKDIITDELKLVRETNENLGREVKSLKDLTNKLDRERETLYDKNLTLQIKIGKSNDLIKHTEEDCTTLKLSVSSLRDKVLQLEKERNILMTERINYETSIADLAKETEDLKSQNKLIDFKFNNLNKEYLASLEQYEEKVKLNATLEEKVIALQMELEGSVKSKDSMETHMKALEIQNQQLSFNLERLTAHVNVLSEENQKILKECKDECEQKRETKAELESYKKQLCEQRSLQLSVQKEIDDLSNKLEKVTREYNACLLQVNKCAVSDMDDIKESKEKSDNYLLMQIKEMQKTYLFKSKELQNKIKTLETTQLELLRSSKTQENFVPCSSETGNKSKKPVTSLNLKGINPNNEQRHQKIIDNLLGENKQLRIKNEKLEKELTSTRTLSQNDRKSRRQSTHDQKRQSLWDSTCEVGTMTQPTDQLCNCQEFDLKVKELKRQLRIKECQINTLLLEMKANPLKEETESLKKLLAQEEVENKKLRIDLLKLKQEMLYQANKQKECSLCVSRANKLLLHKNIQTEHFQSNCDEDFAKLQRKYEDIKLICRKRKDTIRELEERLNTEKENEANNKQNPVGHFENSQEIIETLKEENHILKKKYEQSKVICISRLEDIRSLEARLKKLNFDA